MQTQSSFDLNCAIQHWRENLAQSPAFRRENLDELEAHLRDAVTALKGGGLTEEEAFWVGARRLGSGDALESQFRAVNRQAIWLDRALWMLIGIQLLGLVHNMLGGIARAALMWGWGNLHYDYQENGLVLPVVVFSVVQVLVIAASIALCWWLVVRTGHKLAGRAALWLRRRSTLAALCAALGVFSVATRVLGYGADALWARAVGSAAYGSMVMYFAYSSAIAWPIESVTLIVLTLAVARKRLLSRMPGPRC